MPPNIIFFLIDGLRADQIYGENKTSVTPNIDSLRKKGLYFTNAFSSVDGTILSLRTIFHSNFPIKTGSRTKLTLEKNNLFDVLKENGYKINGLVPDLKGFSEYTNKFENKEKTYPYWEYMEKMEEFYRNTSTSITDVIIKFLEKKEEKPWFYYFHLMTLHPLKEYFASYKNEKNLLSQAIKNFNDKQYGNGLYERTLSFIDNEIGKILKNVDLDNTIVILTADHGQTIPYDEHSEIDFQPKLDNAVSVGKKILPKFAHKFGGQFLYNIRKSVGKRRLEKSNKELSNYEKRSRATFDNVSLYDEMLHIPLLFVGGRIKSQINNHHVHHTDIFPTLCQLSNIKLKNKIEGRDLMRIISEKNPKEKPFYIRTRPYIEEKMDKRDCLGIRTDKYKYFRFARNPDENVHLYDLENDPFENTNIAKGNEKLISEFETKISEIEKNEVSNDDELSEEEQNRISNELKRLGYM